MKWTAPWRYRWLDLHPFWRAFAVAAILTLAIGPSVAGVYRQWKSEKSITGAVLALNSGRPADARRLALLALEHDHTTERALQVLVRSSDQLGDPARGELARKLLATPGTSLPDRFFAWQVVCRSSSAWMVLSTWESLPGDEKSAPDHVAALVDRLVQEEMYIEAIQLIDAQDEPLGIDLRLRRLRLSAMNGFVDSFDAFWCDLTDAVNQQPDETLRLLPILDELPQQAFDTNSATALLAQVPVAYLKDSENALRGARLEMAVSPHQAEEIFSQALAAHREIAPLATLRWCLQLERYAEARSLVKAVRVKEDSDAFALACLAAEREGRLEAWSILLANPVDANDPEMLCDQAYVASLLQNASSRAMAEKAAISAAVLHADDGALIRLARRAEQRGLEDFARRVWLEALRQRTGPLPLATRLEPLIEHLAANKKETELGEVFTTFRLAEPGNPVVRARSSYLSCLAGHVSPVSLAAELEQLDQQLLENKHIRFVLAFAYLLDSRYEEAIELTDDDEVPGLTENHALTAVRGIALSGANRLGEADKSLARLDWDQLLPSEKRLLRSSLGNVPVSRVNSGAPKPVEVEVGLR